MGGGGRGGAPRTVVTLLHAHAVLALPKDETAAEPVADLLAGTGPTRLTAQGAGLCRAQHYHRRNRPVSLADCVAAETARALGAVLGTTDPHLLAMCSDEGIGVLAVPDGKGTVWSPAGDTLLS
jgi:predicted nucleic acid-binding protein